MANVEIQFSAEEFKTRNKINKFDVLTKLVVRSFQKEVKKIREGEKTHETIRLSDELVEKIKSGLSEAAEKGHEEFLEMRARVWRKLRNRILS